MLAPIPRLSFASHKDGKLSVLDKERIKGLSMERFEIDADRADCMD